MRVGCDPFKYDFDTDEFFEEDMGPELKRYPLVNEHYSENYRSAMTMGAHPFDAMNAGSDAAQAQAKFDVDLGYEPSADEMESLRKFWELLGGINL